MAIYTAETTFFHASSVRDGIIALRETLNKIQAPDDEPIAFFIRHKDFTIPLQPSSVFAFGKAEDTASEKAEEYLGMELSLAKAQEDFTVGQFRKFANHAASADYAGTAIFLLECHFATELHPVQLIRNPKGLLGIEVVWALPTMLLNSLADENHLPFDTKEVTLQ